MQSHEQSAGPRSRAQESSKRSTLAKRLALVAGLGALGAGTLAVSIYASPSQAVPGKVASITLANGKETSWIAAAPGRVEPRSGQLRVGSAIPGRVMDVVARMKDRVSEGEVLIRLDDKEARARLEAAQVEAAARKRERDSQPATAGREDVRKVEDAIFTAERAVTNARFELDEILAVDRKTPGSPQLLLQARKQLAESQDKLRQEYVAFAVAHAKAGVPAPSRLEAGLVAARTDVTLAEEALDRTRIRAPQAGTVLQITVKRGEMVAPAPELPLVVMGDMTVMRVRTEVDEHDVAKIQVGQKAFVRSAAFPGREFEGRVTELAPSLALPRMGSRGARRATDVEVMEVMINLEAAVPLLPGMRTDAFFRQAN